MTNIKKRNWTFLLYQDSAPKNWKTLIEETGLEGCISPLHDKDINLDGSIKKPHYHIIICFKGPTSYNVVKRITDSLNSPIPKKVEQVRGYYRYLTHKDNPEKVQYNEKDIQAFNGFDILKYNELSKNEINKIKIEIQNMIRNNKILEYSDLMDELLDKNMEKHWEVASTNTYFFDKYISSNRCRIKNKDKQTNNSNYRT